jgi:hypothetical protein
MFGITNNKAQRIRRAGIIAGTVGLAVAAAMVAPQAFGNDSDAPTRPARAVETTEVDTSSTEVADAEVTYEEGVAVAGFGELNGRQVFVEIYANSVYGSQATVMVEQPGGPELSAAVDLATEDVLDGDVELDLALSRNTRGGLAPTRSRAQIVGTWEASGPSTEIDETFEDAGYLIHTTGTNTPLAADVVVTIDGKAVSVEVHDAFAYDLTVTRTAL